MLHWITNEMSTPPRARSDRPYGHTQYAVEFDDGTQAAFTLPDVLERYEQLVELHGEKIVPLLKYIKSTLLDW